MTVQDTLKSFVQQLKKGIVDPGNDDIYDDVEGIIPYSTENNLALDTEIKQTNLKTLDSKVVPFNKNNTEVKICEPRTYGESVELVKLLKDKKSIIVNLNFLDAAQACRLVDFLCGATHALNGNQSKISENVFIFTPMNVSLSAETQDNKMVKDALWTN